MVFTVGGTPRDSKVCGHPPILFRRAHNHMYILVSLSFPDTHKRDIAFFQLRAVEDLKTLEAEVDRLQASYTLPGTPVIVLDYRELTFGPSSRPKLSIAPLKYCARHWSAGVPANWCHYLDDLRYSQKEEGGLVMLLAPYSDMMEYWYVHIATKAYFHALDFVAVEDMHRYRKEREEFLAKIDDEEESEYYTGDDSEDEEEVSESEVDEFQDAEVDPVVDEATQEEGSKMAVGQERSLPVVADPEEEDLFYPMCIHARALATQRSGGHTSH